jgi:hypothetical protein
MLIDRPVEIGPLSGDLQVGLVDEPPVPGNVAARPGRLDELRSEPLHPPVDGDVIDGDTPLGQQFLDVPVGKSIAQVPADRDRDHLPREPEASKDRGRATRSHPTSLHPSGIDQRNSATTSALMDTVLTAIAAGHATPSAVYPPGHQRGHGLTQGLEVRGGSGCSPASGYRSQVSRTGLMSRPVGPDSSH